jgi:hypothetical protein
MVEGGFAANQHVHPIDVQALNWLRHVRLECQELFALSAEAADLWERQFGNGNYCIGNAMEYLGATGNECLVLDRTQGAAQLQKKVIRKLKGVG